MIRGEFLDLVNYGICRAVSEAVGPERASEIMRQAGRHNFHSLVAQQPYIRENDPLKTLANIAKFLEEVGYAERVVVKRVSDKVLEMDMYGISVIKSSYELIHGGFSPSHISTNLMFAALENQGVTADLEELHFDLNTNHVKERWTLVAK